MRMACPPTPQHTVLSAGFADFEEFAAATRGWDLEFRQLDAGASPSELSQIVTPELNVMRARMSRRYFQAGAAPPGARTVALVEELSGGVAWCGRRVLPSSLQTFRNDGDFEAVSDPGFEVYTITVQADLLAGSAAELGVAEFGDCVGQQEHQLVDAASSAALRGVLRALFSDVERGRLGHPRALEHLAELPEQLARAVASSSPAGPPPAFGVRDRARRRAIDWIEDRLHTAPTVRELSRDLGVSRRTLEYAFREQLGVSPKRYLLARRLGAVRADLRSASPGEGVTDVANRYGFWHMGDFAAAYRRQFGELPSGTLAAAIDRPGSPSPREA